ncbi:MAG TPA: AMP-binding protein [Acidimicrobiia bacterium]|nr:AMP-binding protein [Acidimicrobiia bacterium]
MLPGLAASAARRFGERTAYVAPTGRRVSYAELDDVSTEVAAGLIRAGLTEGDVLALVIGSVPEYPIAYLAAAKIGAITTGVNTRLSHGERERVLAVAAPALVIDDPNAVHDLRRPGEVVPALEPNPDRPVAIVFTSGTTGTPKGVVFGERQLDFITRTDTGGTWGAGGDQIAGTSFAHLAFMTKLPGKLMGGGVSWMMTEWRARDALEMTSRHKMTRIGGIPTQVALMLREPTFDACDLSSVNTIIIGGGPATPALVAEARRRFDAPVLVRYACTEAGIGTGTGVHDPPEDAETTVGRPQPGVELRLEGGAGSEDGVGEVCLRSPATMIGYWRDPAATAAALTSDGFVRTGDLGRFDDRGRLHLVGRTKEMYVRGGYNVYPAEVEALLSRHPDVIDVAVVPRSDEVMGEVGVAVIVPRELDRPPSLDALRAFARNELARHKLPEDVVVIARLPLTPMDKVDRTALATLVQTSHPRRLP